MSWEEDTRFYYDSPVLWYNWHTYDSEGNKTATYKTSRNMHIWLSTQYHELKSLEELAIDFKDLLNYVEKNIFKRLNGMKPFEALRFLADYDIILYKDSLNFEIDYQAFRSIALIAGAYRPATIGAKFENLPVNLVYLGLGVIALPSLVKGLGSIISETKRKNRGVEEIK